MRTVFAIALSLPLFLSGCALSPTAGPAADPGVSIQGEVHGGQQPIVGAHVYLFAANTTGNAGPGIAASSGNASVSLLSSSSTGTSDSVGAYVLTGAGGSFTITGDYSCTPNTQVYLYSLGGNSGFGGNNPSAGLLAALGNCPNSGSFAGSNSYVVINEVTTIAAAYALSGFATDATHVSSSGSALALVGIQNAFANAGNLANLADGTARATTPNGNGTVPQNLIYSLANILASCVNSTGAIPTTPSPTVCHTLFINAKSGGSSGTIPPDTATAAINIAHNPGSNIAALYGLPVGQTAFGGALSSQPNDFTIGIEFTGGGLNDPYAIAIDGSGNAWITNNGGGSTLTKLSSTGVPLSPSGGFVAGDGLGGYYTVAIDTAGNVWVPNYYENSVAEFSNSGSVISAGYTGGSLNGCYGLAVDGSNDAWVTNYGSLSVTELSGAGSVTSGTNGYTGSLGQPISIAIDGGGAAWVANKGTSTVAKFSSNGTLQSSAGFSGGGLNIPYAIAIDGSGNAWVASYGSIGTSNLTEFSSSGAAVSPSTGYTTGGVSSPDGVAVDGSGNVWTANVGNNSVSELTNAGVAISPSTGFTGGGVNTPDAIAVDGSGDVWTANPYASNVTELIGASTPVVTPLAVAVKNNTLGSRP